MKHFIAGLAYASAAALTILSVFVKVPIYLTLVSVILWVLGALSAWSEPARVPCRCKGCGVPAKATAEDVRQ